jgi:hypothetical protein
MDNKAIKPREQLLDAYFSHPGTMPESWYHRVQQLFFETTSEEEKFAALEMCFNKMVQYDPNPDDDVYSSFEEVKADLDFPNSPQRI